MSACFFNPYFDLTNCQYAENWNFVLPMHSSLTSNVYQRTRIEGSLKSSGHEENMRQPKCKVLSLPKFLQLLIQGIWTGFLLPLCAIRPLADSGSHERFLVIWKAWNLILKSSSVPGCLRILRDVMIFTLVEQQIGQGASQWVRPQDED